MKRGYDTHREIEDISKESDMIALSLKGFEDVTFSTMASMSRGGRQQGDSLTEHTDHV